jgi:hypothetical protein
MYRWEGERVVEGWTLLSSPAKYGERLGERRMSSASTDRRARRPDVPVEEEVS